jgi:hypothetical protein
VEGAIAQPCSVSTLQIGSTTRMKVRADLDRAGIRPYKRKRGRHRRADAHEG